MSLAPGTRVGAYEVVSSLGAGGMGEVYRARDPKLGREVALKILPELFANDPDRLARFEREAKALASLNHPHIAHVYGLEERALVMELVEGDDLSQHLARGPIPVEDALPIARQIADALEAAHDQGIIHRDLKPANIKVRPDGTVKVLDFGLAKAVEQGGVASRLHDSPTITSPVMTAAGLILGTAAYMSPEQAKGKVVDKRADIWAFGCVLYEMLTARQAFHGDSVTETLSAITRDQPDWSALPVDTPAEVRRLLDRTLIKDATQRLRDIGEARILLSRADLTSAAPVVSGSDSSRVRWARGALGAIGIAAAAAAAGFALGGSRTEAPPPVTVSFTQLTEQPGVERQPTIAPDGRSVVYVSDARGNADLYLLRVGGRNAVLLTADSTFDDYAPAFSPDGNRIAFRSQRAGGGIFVMEATGESVRRVSDFGFDPDWSPDGRSLVVADEAVNDPMSRISTSGIWAISLQDGARRQVSRRDGVGAKWSPGGARIAYWGRGRSAQRDLYTVASDGSEIDAPRAVTDDVAVDWSPAWSPDGAFLYFASSRGGTMNLWRVAIDESTGQTRGTPESQTTPTAWSGWFDISSDGRHIVFADLDERATVWTSAFDPAAGAMLGQPRVVLQGRAINSIDVSPDGRRLAFSQRGQPWEWLGVIGVDGSGWSRLTEDSAYHRLPQWSPDGQRLLFYMRQGDPGLWTIRADGSGLTPLPIGPRSAAPVTGATYPVWSPDGTRIVYSTDTTIDVLDAASTPLRPIASMPSPATVGYVPFSWSADGRWIAMTSYHAETNRDRVEVFDSGLTKGRVVAAEGKSPMWLPDSRRLLISLPTTLAIVDVESGSQRPIVANTRTEQGSWGRLISLSRDGRTLAYLATQRDGDVWLMTIERAPTHD